MGKTYKDQNRYDQKRHRQEPVRRKDVHFEQPEDIDWETDRDEDIMDDAPDDVEDLELIAG